VQLHDVNHISDGQIAVEPVWEIPQTLGEGEFCDFAIVRVKRVCGGPCQLGGKWTIVEEIALRGRNPGVLLGSPAPVICSGHRADDPSSWVCPDCNETHTFVRRLGPCDCTRCGKHCSSPGRLLCQC
jgi:hypothetical protein